MFKCINGHEVEVMPSDGLCPECGEPLMKATEVKKVEEPSEELQIHQGNYGLALFVLDVSGSMKDEMPGSTPALRSKLDFVRHAVNKALEQLTRGATSIRKPEYQYLGFIPFSQSATISWLGSVKEMNDRIGNSNDYFQKFVLDNAGPAGIFDGTNITAGLEIAHQIYREALNGTIAGKSFGNFSFPPDFQLNSQSIFVSSTKDTVFVPNIRIFVYSNGEHTIGAFRNPFDNESILPGIVGDNNRLVNGIVSLFFGHYNSGGARLMEDIAGFCPQHNKVGFFNIQEINITNFSLLRELIHNTSRASGFCLECVYNQLE